MIHGLLLLTVMFAAEPAPAPSGPTAEGQDRALRAEQLEVAQRLVSTLPRSDDALYLLALVHQEQGNMAKVVDCCQRALQLDPGRADVYDTMGQVALLKEEYERAVELFGKARAIDPAMVGVGHRTAQALIRMGKLREAIAAAEEDLRLVPSAYNSCRLVGEAYLQLGEYQQAKERFLAAIAIQPDLTEAHYGLAVACARLGQQDEARKYRERFQALDAKRLEDGRKWRAVYDPLVGTRLSTAHTHTDAGRVYQQFGYAWTAEKLWRRAAELDPQNTTCRLLLVGVYQQNNQPKEALKLCQEIIQAEPGNPVGHLTLGMAQQRLGQTAAAEASLRKVIELAPERPEGYHALAMLYVQTKQKPAQAESLAAKAVELAPGNAQYQETLSRIRSTN